MAKTIVLVFDVLSCLFIFIAVILSTIESASSDTYSTILQDITRSLRSDFVHNISVPGGKCSKESSINLGFWPGTVDGCNCLGIRSQRGNEREEIN